MIYVVEFPHDARPRAWFAFDMDDFIRKVWASEGSSGAVIFETGTPRSWLEQGESAPTGGKPRALVEELAAKFGWDTPLFRADHLLGEETYQTEPVTEFDACIASLSRNLYACRVYLSDGAATSALYGDPIYDGREGFHAHMALREQLISMEVISDDL